MAGDAGPRILYKVKDGYLYVVGKNVTIVEQEGELSMAFKLRAAAVDKMIESLTRLRKRMT